MLAAAGSAPWNGGFAHVDVERLTVAFDRTGGIRPRRADRGRARAGGSSVAIQLDLGLGSGSAAYLASDLTYDYGKLNAEYTT